MTRRLTLALALLGIIGLLAVGGTWHAPTFHTFAAASTPPPPPGTVPTPIGPPPLPPSPTPTITPTATATSTPTVTPTSAPLGAPVRIVASASLQHQGKLAIVHWRMAFQLGIKGFHIFAGRTQLTRSLIRPHHSPNYTARVPWVQGSKYALRVLFTNGHAQTISVH